MATHKMTGMVGLATRKTKERLRKPEYRTTVRIMRTAGTVLVGPPAEHSLRRGTPPLFLWFTFRLRQSLAARKGVDLRLMPLHLCAEVTHS